MPNVGTITGSMYLDPSAYISGLNTAAGATRSFQQGMTSVSFAGFNRGIFATTTLLYGLERIMSNMSKGMEEYANMLGRIGTVADLTAASVGALADSMKQISVYQGVSRKDIMGGMYTAAQAGYDSPAEMRVMASSGARLSRASGKEIDVKKGVDLQSGIRQALGIGMNAVSSNRMNDILLKGRDIGRWELDQMAHALGIPLTVWGNQFAGKQDGEETLRQLLSVMSVASLAGVSPNMTATGTRRIVEKTLQLNKSGKVGDPLRNALRGVGFTGKEPILDALNQGGMKYLNTLMNVTGDGQTSELTRLGYGSRDLLVLTSAMRGKGQKLNEAYEQLSYGNAAGTTERYGEKMRGTYDYSRDRLRSQWEITSQQFMQASIPLIGSFTSMLEGFNKVAQSLPESVKSFMLLIGAMTAARLFLNFVGFRSKAVGNAVGATGSSVAGGAGALGGVATPAMWSAAADPKAARLARMQAMAGKRPWSMYSGPQASSTWQGSTAISGSGAPSSLAAMGWMANQPKLGIVEDMRREALRNQYVMGSGGIPMTSTKYGPSMEARIRWAAYKRGQSVNFNTGSYGSLSPTAQNYFATRGKTPGSLGVADLRGQTLAYGGSEVGKSGAIIANMGAQAKGIGPASLMYGGLGMSGSGEIFKAVGSKVFAFGSAITSTLGPLAKFTALIGVVGKLIEGWSYGGRGGPDKKLGGLGTWEKKDAEPGMLDTIGLGYSMIGATARGRFDLLGDMRDDYAEKHGYVSAEGAVSPMWNLLKKSGAMGLAMNPLTSTFGMPLLKRALKSSPIGLEGYRKGTVDDAMGRLSRENLTPGQVQKMRAGGIDFDKFSSAKGYISKFMRSQLNMNAPEDWDAWMRGDQIGSTQIMEDALKFYSGDIVKAAAENKSTSAVRTSRNGTKYTRDGGFYKLVAKPALKTAGGQRFGAPDWGGVAQGVSPETMTALANQRILSERQWDIYSGADYSGRRGGNGGLNWGAGGKDYRAMYNTELGNLDARFGGFTDQSYSANVRDPLTYKGGGLRALMGKKGQFKDDTSLGFMLDRGDEDFARNQKLRQFLKVMPDIGKMPEEEARKHFMSLTGRNDMTDVYAKANFDNFRNMDVSKYVTTEQTSNPVQYASATQFGTADAYNQLLQRDNPSEKMNIAVDKLGEYLKSLSVTKEESESELQKVVKAAAKFFEQPGVDTFFENVKQLKEEVVDEGGA